ncbi:MAG: hypothetical protein F4155_08580 [Acidimicrobiales bacterium]|nr:hypothetical protein [Acidimicrobiales bacterium]MYH74839.1 hypothetical protein [Acidimicrobiales bacterium]MYK71300.1 hypothetical protein [Acidimicrobiales bacterium]
MELEAEVLRILRDIPELRVQTDRAAVRGADAVIRGAGTQTPIAVEVKARVNAANVHQIIHHAQDASMPVVVIAREMTEGAREALAAQGVGTIDGLGNIRLELPGLLVRVDGTAPRPRTKTRATLSGKSSLVAQAMLLDSGRSWHVADLAEHAGVSPALAHRVLQRLGDLEIVASQGAGPSKRRRLVEPSALFDLWVEEHRDRSRRYPAFMLASTTDDLAATVCRNLESAGVTYALTGAAAIARVAPILTSIPVVEVWLEGIADPATVCEEIGADQVTSGPNVVLQQERDDVPLAYRTQRDGVWLVNVCRLYIDVRRDPQRGSEQADHLRREAIGF